MLACLVAYVVGSMTANGVRMLEEVVFGPIALWLRWFEETLIVSVMAGGLGFWLTLRWFKSKDSKFFAYYLMHDYAYSAKTRGENPAELEARMAIFQSEIAAAMNSSVDEVLVVGHSSVAHLGVSILSDLMREHGVARNGPKTVISFIGAGGPNGFISTQCLSITG